MRCLADFLLDSDLCLGKDEGPLILSAPDGSYTLTLGNAGTDDKPPPVAVLSAQLIFEAPSFDNIRELAIEKLGRILNCLVYTTSRQFSLHAVKKIVDWTPGLAMRDAIVYVETPEWDEAEPALVRDYIDTAERFLAMHGGDVQHSAMRWYRLGIQATQIEEQFSYFWFALEIVAATLKDTEKVPSNCPHCASPLYCNECAKHPVHRRYPAQAIEHLVKRLIGEDADEIFTTLQRIRHTLMHGERIITIERELPCTQEQAVNKLARLTHCAIGLLFDKADPRAEKDLAMGYVENIVRRRIIASVQVQTGMHGDSDNPQLSDFPDMTFDLVKQ